MKKNYYVVIIAIILAIGGCYNGLKSYSNDILGYNDLLKQNIEALTDEENDDGVILTREQCLQHGGEWNMASVCEASGIETTTCDVDGEISAFGITIKGSYKKGKQHQVIWARYKCVTSPENCCTQQGVYIHGIRET